MQVVRVKMEHEISDAALGFYVKELFNSGKVKQVVIADERETAADDKGEVEYVPN